MKLLCEFTKNFSIRYEREWIYVIAGLRTLTIGISQWNYKRHGIYKWTLGKRTKCWSLGYHGTHYEQYFGKFLMVIDWDKYESYEYLDYYFMNN